MKWTFAAAIFALLTVTAVPGHATTIGPIDAVNLTFANGDTVTGEIGWWEDVYIPGASFPFTGPTGLTINGYPFLGGQGAPNGYTINGVSASLYAILADVPNLTPNEFFLDSSYGSVVGGSPDGIPGVSGTVSCVSGCGVSAVPIPAASPLFGSALLALAGLAAYRSRRTRRG